MHQLCHYPHLLCSSEKSSSSTQLHNTNQGTKALSDSVRGKQKHILRSYTALSKYRSSTENLYSCSRPIYIAFPISLYYLDIFFHSTWLSQKSIRISDLLIIWCQEQYPSGGAILNCEWGRAGQHIRFWEGTTSRQGKYSYSRPCTCHQIFEAVASWQEPTRCRIWQQNFSLLCHW